MAATMYTAGASITVTSLTDMVAFLSGARREPFSSTPPGVGSISLGSRPPHARPTPMGRACGARPPYGIKKSPHPKQHCRSGSCVGLGNSLPVLQHLCTFGALGVVRVPSGSIRPRWRPIRFRLAPARTMHPHKAYVWCLTAQRNQEKYPPDKYYRSLWWAGV